MAALDADASRHEWVHLDLPRTLRGVRRSYGWPVGSMSARLALPGSALGGAQRWAVTVQPPVEEPHAPSRYVEAATAAASEQVQTPGQAPESTSEPLPQPEARPSELRDLGRIPKSDIIFVGR